MEKQTQQNPFKKTIDDINTISERMEDAINNSENAERLKNDPSYQIYNHIYQSSVAVFNDPEVKKTFATIEEKMGKDVSISLVSLIVLALTHASYDAIAYYDAMIRDDLNEQFAEIIQHIQGNNADIEGIKAAVQVHNKRIEALASKEIVEDFAKQNNITPEQ